MRQLIAIILLIGVIGSAVAGPIEITIVPRIPDQGPDTWNVKPLDKYLYDMERVYPSGNTTYTSGVRAYIERPEVWFDVDTVVKGRHRITFRVWTNRDGYAITGVKVRLRFKWRRKYQVEDDYERYLEGKYERNWEETVVLEEKDIWVTASKPKDFTVTVHEWLPKSKKRSMWEDAIYTAGSNYVWDGGRVGFRYYKDLKCEAKIVWIKQEREE